ncbi:anti-sigma factor domain-containing protein [Bacillota bacterium Lsc_1132]
MKQGIIMEINDDYLTLLTPEGEFLRARKQNHQYAVGEEILFFPLTLRETNRSFSLVKRFMSVKVLATAAIAIILFFGSFLSFYQNNKAYAYMSIDVNPSIELVLNKKMQVLKVTAYNQDGKKIVAHIGDWKKKSIAELTQLLLNEMKKQGYFKNHHLVVISTVRTDKKEQSAEKVLSENMEEIKAAVKEKKLQMTVLNGTPEELAKAHKLGITTGKYKESKVPKNKTNKPDSKDESSKMKSQMPDGNQIPKGNPIAPAAPHPSVIHPEKNQGSMPSLPESAKQGNDKREPGTPKSHPEKPIPPGQVKKIEEPKEKLKEINVESKDKVEKEIKRENEEKDEEMQKVEEQGKNLSAK